MLKVEVTDKIRQDHIGTNKLHQQFIAIKYFLKNIYTVQGLAFFFRERNRTVGCISKIIGIKIVISLLPLINTINPIGIFEKPIVRKFVLDIKKDQTKTSKSNGQSTNINKGIKLLLQQVSQNNDIVVPKYDGRVLKIE